MIMIFIWIGSVILQLHFSKFSLALFSSTGPELASVSDRRLLCAGSDAFRIIMITE